MNGRNKRSRWFAISMIGWLAISVPAFANEPKRNNGMPEISNFGFMENPTKEMKEKFPMCDSFLKVDWVDKEKKIGVSDH